MWLCLATPALALTPLEQTRQTLEQAREIVGSAQTHDEKLAALSRLLKGFLDTDAMGRAALDSHWDGFSSVQQREFLTLFRELFQRTYVQKLLLFEKPDFAYVGEQAAGDNVDVLTKIVTPRDEFAVTYRLHRTGDIWQATDIQIEDLSLTANFRRQLDRLITKSSPENVIERMRHKYGSAGSGEDEDL